MLCLSGFELYSRWVPLIFKVDFLKVVRMVFWSGVIGRSRFMLTIALRAQKLYL